MAHRSPSRPVAIARGRVAALSRSRSHDDPEYISAQTHLKTLSLSEHVAKVVDSWPPLTPEQLDRVAVLLRGGAK